MGDKGFPGPQRLRGGNGDSRLPDTSGRQLKWGGIQDGEGSRQEMGLGLEECKRLRGHPLNKA